MTAFVGRSAERERLAKLLDAAASGRGQALFVTGEAGAGKSTLIEQARADAAGRIPDLLVLHATCSEQFGAGEPYQPFVEAFRDLLTEAGGEGSRWAHFRQLAGELAPTWISAIPLAGGLIAATVSTAVELRRLGGGGATAASEEALFFQYAELLFAAAAERPILLLLDDLHWADGASVALLTHIARRAAEERIAIIGTFRPADVEVTKHPIRETRLELERYGVATEMPLGPLDAGALRDLATHVLGGPPARDLLEWAEERAGANPLFFQELLRWAADHGIAAPRTGEWWLERVPDAIEVPRTAAAAIERRLQRLDPETYRVLEYASVQGDDFEVGILARLMAADELQLEDTLDAVARTHRLVQLSETRELPDGDITSVYRFGHSLVQDVLHGNLQGKRRILLHRRVAEILEALYGDDARTVAHRLAVHCDEGRLADRAVRYALTGADRANRLYAHRAAMGLLQRALRNAPSGRPRLETLRRLGDTHRMTGNLVEAGSAFSEALSLAEAERDEVDAVGIERRLLLVRRLLIRSRDEIERDIQRVLARAYAANATAERCHLLWLWSNLPGTDPTTAIARCRDALDLADADGDSELKVRARFALGRVLALLGTDPRHALAPLEECLAAVEGNDRTVEGATRNVIAIVHVKLGNYRDAADSFEQAAATFDEIGDPIRESEVLNNLAVLLSRLGDWDAAETRLSESLRISRRMGWVNQMLAPLENLAAAAEARGEAATALARWEELATHAASGGWWSAQVIGLAGQGRVHLAAGRIDAAREAADRAAALLPPGDVASEASIAWHQLAARIAAAEADVAAAMCRLDAVEPALTRSDRYEWAVARVLRAELLSPHDPAAAADIARAALAILEQLQATPMIRRAEAVLRGRTE